MRAYFVSVLLGIVVGVIYGMLKVKAPVPPMVALFGLFGMLAGEQLVQQVRDWRNPQAAEDAKSMALKGQPASTPDKVE